jgi:hypothetical protein
MDKKHKKKLLWSQAVEIEVTSKKNLLFFCFYRFHLTFIESSFNFLWKIKKYQNFKLSINKWIHLIR